MFLLGPLVVLSTLFGCNGGDSGAVWVRFNHPDDAIGIDIKNDEPGEDIYADILSTTGEAIVGDIRISPGSGPVGTEHLLVVTVFTAYEDRVRKVELQAFSGPRGVLEFDPEQDSADLGIWVARLTSYGEEGEERHDSFGIDLWELDDDPVPADLEER